jgi:hypothetical protein
MSASALKLSVQVVVPTRSESGPYITDTVYADTRRLRAGDRVPEIVEAIFQRLLVKVRRQHKQPHETRSLPISAGRSAS